MKSIFYYRKFINGYAGIAKPITDLLKNASKTSNKRIQWNADADAALVRLKKELLERITLSFPDYRYPLDIHSDASGSAIAGILSQLIDGIDRPIFFFSRVLSPLETRYHSLELEAMSLLYCLKQTRVWTLGHPVRIRTDCRSLICVTSGCFAMMLGERVSFT